MMRRGGALALTIVALVFPPATAPAAQTDKPAGGFIMFVGSSIFHRWTNLQAQMAPLPIVNIAFDGAVTDDMLRLVDPQVIPRRPRVVAYYAGSNDVDVGEPATEIISRIKSFVTRVTTALPDTNVVFVSVNRAPEKRERWNVVDAVNRGIETWAPTARHVSYVDVNPALFNADGSSRLELFMTDRLHLRPAAYEEFARILKPVLTRAFGAGAIN